MDTVSLVWHAGMETEYVFHAFENFPKITFLSPHGKIYGDMSFTVCFSVCFSVTPSTKSTNFGSRYLVDGFSERDEIWHFDRGGLAIDQHSGW